MLVLTSPFTAEAAAPAPAIVLPPQGRNLDAASLEITLSSRCFDEDKLRIVDSLPHVEAFSPAQTQFITEELRALLQSSSEILVLACDLSFRVGQKAKSEVIQVLHLLLERLTFVDNRPLPHWMPYLAAAGPFLRLPEPRQGHPKDQKTSNSAKGQKPSFCNEFIRILSSLEYNLGSSWASWETSGGNPGGDPGGHFEAKPIYTNEGSHHKTPSIHITTKKGSMSLKIMLNVKKLRLV